MSSINWSALHACSFSGKPDGLENTAKKFLEAGIRHVQLMMRLFSLSGAHAVEKGCLAPASLPSLFGTHSGRWRLQAEPYGLIHLILLPP